MNAQALQDRTLVWKGILLNTTEHCQIITEGNRIRVRGSITGLAEHQPININYQIELTRQYQIKSLILESLSNPSFKIELTHTDEKWFDNRGRHLVEYDRCAYIDIALTPYTNTIPINRLELPEGGTCKIDVVYIDPLEKKLTRMQQNYTKLNANKYRYESPGTHFVSEIEVDSDGIVCNYPGIWELIYPESEIQTIKKKTENPQDFASVLISSERSPDIDSSSDIYAPMLGSWKLKVVDHSEDGSSSTYSGNWIFSRVLEGRAIQDIFVCPGFSDRFTGMSKMKNRYGTTMRMFDLQTHQWHIDWFNPVSGRHDHLTARVESDRIIHESPEKDGLEMKWVFENIEKNSFHWSGYESGDKGKTWKLSSEFFASRIE